MLLTSCLDIEEFFSVKLLVSSYLRVLVVDLHLICDDTLRSRFSTIRDQPQRAIRQCVKVSIICRSCDRSEEHTSELQSRFDLVCRLLLEKKKQTQTKTKHK